MSSVAPNMFLLVPSKLKIFQGKTETIDREFH